MGKKKSSTVNLGRTTIDNQLPLVSSSSSSGAVIQQEGTLHKQVDGEEIKPITHELFSLKISELVHTKRVQNGLRHGDARRYHKYCTRRLSYLRGKLKFKNGRHRYVAKYFPSDFLDPRYLHIPMVSAERSWAAHLEMKNALSTPETPNGLISLNGVNVKPRCVVHWANRRLARALVFATWLFNQCERHCDKQTVMEAKAYRELFAGLLATEKRDWQCAMELLLESRRLYVQLASLASTDPTHSTAVNEQLSTIDLHLRTASYYLARMGVDVSQFRVGIEDGQTKSINNTAQISLYWRGVQISLPEELVSKAKITDILESITSNLKSNQQFSSFRSYSMQKLVDEFCQQKSWQQMTEHYSEVQKAAEQSLSLIHASLLDLDTSNESETGHFFLLESLARDFQQSCLIEMNLALLLLGLLEYLSVYGDTTTLLCSPQLGVFLSDLVLQLITISASQLNSSRCPSKIQEKLTASSEVLRERFIAWKQIVNDCRAMFVALFMIDNKKTQEAFVLVSSLRRSRRSPEKIDTELGLPDSKLWIDSPFFRIGMVITLLDSIITHVEPRIEIDAAAALVTSSEEPVVNIKATDVLTKLSEKLNFPTELKVLPIPCKPILFDLAEATITPPINKSDSVTPTAGESVMRSMIPCFSSLCYQGFVGKLASWWRK